MHADGSVNVTTLGVPIPKDDYCYICEDGGSVIECNLCHRAFCYGVIDEVPANEEQVPCIQIPSQIANDKHHAFPCPECLYECQAPAAPYVINRGPRVTMRRVPRASVVLVVFAIDSLMPLALSVHEQIQAALSGFEMNVATHCGALHHGLPMEDEISLMEQLGDQSVFNLVCCFFTESHPGGGWWSRSGKHTAQSGEHDFLQFLGNQVRRLSRKALTTRYFGSACGWNLPGRGVVAAIKTTLEPSRTLSIVLPTAGSLLQCDYAHILPELCLNLYYFGTPLEASLYKVWGQSEEVRKHTGILVLSRPTSADSMHVQKVTYSPLLTRPMGVLLPIPSTICGCSCEDDETWDRILEVTRALESIFVYCSRCCGTMLQLVVFNGSRRSFFRNDAHFSIDTWNTETHSFDFKESTMVRMKVFPKPADRRNVHIENGAWTIEGKAAAARKAAAEANRQAAAASRS